VRFSGYSISALFVGLYGLLLSALLAEGLRIGGADIVAWAFVIGGASLALMIGTVWYVARSENTGGYALIGLSATAATFMCFVGILPFSSPI